jgi:hypothetical protein
VVTLLRVMFSTMQLEEVSRSDHSDSEEGAGLRGRRARINRAALFVGVGLCGDSTISAGLAQPAAQGKSVAREARELESIHYPYLLPTTCSFPLAFSATFLSPILFLHPRTMSAPGYYNSPPQMSQGGYFPPQQGAAPPRDGARFVYSSNFRSQAAPRKVATTPNSPSRHTRARPTAPRPKVTLNRVVTTPSSRRRRPSTCSCSAVYLRVP